MNRAELREVVRKHREKARRCGKERLAQEDKRALKDELAARLREIPFENIPPWHRDKTAEELADLLMPEVEAIEQDEERSERRGKGRPDGA